MHRRLRAGLRKRVRLRAGIRKRVRLRAGGIRKRARLRAGIRKRARLRADLPQLDRDLDVRVPERGDERPIELGCAPVRPDHHRVACDRVRPADDERIAWPKRGG